MKEFENNAYFWQKVDSLYSTGDFKLKHWKGDQHKRHPSLKYPCDFGEIRTFNDEGECSMEVYRKGNGRVDALILCADILTKRFEVKGIVGLDDDEILEVLTFLNKTDFQKGVLIKRGKDTPAWAISDN